MKSMRVRILFTIFFVSGFCGLIYESIWSHYLKLLLGHAAYAQAVVLVVFIGGMAMGAWLTGRWSERLRHPILIYAGVEVLVAAVAFGFHLVFVDASQWALDWLLPTLCGSDGPCLANWLLAAGLILPPSILLGTTFPLMSAGVLRLGMAPGRGLALLYFLNSAGAALGVLASGFWLIPSYGLPGALLIAGSLNVAVALAAWLAIRWGRVPPPPAPAMVKMDRPGGDNEGVRLLLAVAALTGLSSFIYEIAWIRMLTQVLGAATHSFELMLASFIFGLALGGLWVRNRIDRLDQPQRLLAWVQIAMGVLAVATLPLYLFSFDVMAFALRALQRSAEGYALFTSTSAAVAMAVMLPATFCAGMTLPIITAALLRQGHGERQIGAVYAANTLGAIVGVLLTVYVLMPQLGLKWALAVGALIDIGLGIVLLRRNRVKHPHQAEWTHWAGMLTALSVSIALPAATPFSAERLASGVYRTGSSRIGSDQSVLMYEDGRTSTISVLERRDGLRMLLTNGKVDGSTYPDRTNLVSPDDPTMVLLGTLGPLHLPTAKRAAIVGLGTGITTAALLNSSTIESVETIEIEPLMIDAAQLFRPRNRSAFDDPRSRIVIDDARAHLARARTPYDLIVSEPSNPWVSGVSGLFTSEFYQLVASKLSAHGVFVQWLQLYQASPELVGSIVQAFAFYFPEFRVYASNSADVILVGRVDGKAVEIQSSAFLNTGLRAELLRAGISSEATLAAHEVGRGSTIKLLFAGQGVPANSDFFPYVDNRAGRDRFMSASAGSMQLMHLSPVPLLELRQPPAAQSFEVDDAGAVMPPRLHAMTRARLGHGILRGESLTADHRRLLTVNEGNYSASLKDYNASRSFLFGCASMDPSTILESLVLVAGQINTGLSPTHAQKVWRDALSGPCNKKFSESQKRWLRLFAAVGARDPGAMQDQATPLLSAGPALSQAQHEYLVLAAVGAAVALGDQAGALKTFQVEGARIPAERVGLPWFRYLTLILTAQRKAATPSNTDGRTADATSAPAPATPSR